MSIEALLRAEVMAVNGAVAPDGTVQLGFGAPSVQNATVIAGVQRKRKSPFDLDIFAKDRLVATWHPVLVDRRAGRYEGALPAGEPLTFRVKVPVTREATHVVARIGDRVLGTLPIPAEPPSIESDPVVSVDKTRGAVEIAWNSQAGNKGEVLVASVRVSLDGEQWTTLASHVTASPIKIPTKRLPGGNPLHLNVRVTDGAHVISRTLVIRGISEPRLDVLILKPVPNFTFREGLPVHLEAVASLRAARTEPDRFEYLWTIDGKEAAKGAKAVWKEAVDGEHEISVAARYGEVAGEATCRINVQPRKRA